MEKVFEKILSNGKRFDGKVPSNPVTYDGKYSLTGGGGWTDGFYIGIFYLSYILTGNIEFRSLAEKYDDFLSDRIENSDEINEKYSFLKLDHDVGMIFLPSAGLAYKISGKKCYLDMMIKAAEVLCERYNEKGNFIRAWDTWSWDTDTEFIEEKKGKVIIDSMMNIPLLFQAYKITGKHRYYDIAFNHADTMLKHIIREDGSTFHSYNFDYMTGKPVSGKTVQGFSDNSCWARGQAWAIYGFALAYKYTNNEAFSEASKKAANYFMNHLSSVDLPCWDFSASNEIFAPWDSSAAVIAASGMLEIFEKTTDEAYLNYAKRLLSAIKKFCLTSDYPSCEPLILHGCIGSAYRADEPNKIVNPYIGQGLVYGDYFYIECLLKLSNNDIRVF